MNDLEWLKSNVALMRQETDRPEVQAALTVVELLANSGKPVMDTVTDLRMAVNSPLVTTWLDILRKRLEATRRK